MNTGAVMGRKKVEKKPDDAGVGNAKLFANRINQLNQVVVYLKSKYNRDVSVAEAFDYAAGKALHDCYVGILKELQEDAK